MTVEHEQSILRTALEALGGDRGRQRGTACHLSFSTLDDAIILFLFGEKKMFALNSLLEENGFTFLGCVRTPRQG